jgi:hypothetical protein
MVPKEPIDHVQKLSMMSITSNPPPGCAAISGPKLAVLSHAL